MHRSGAAARSTVTEHGEERGHCVMTASVTPAGDRSAGTYVCMRCTNRLTVVSATRLSPCPVCGGDDWQSAGDETRAVPAAAVEANLAPAPGAAQPRGL
jgi:hypothetical protein